ncbi:unnamed protein product [Cylindrotheca closterium]|uniref:Phosphodiesterase n=1 Tax=Cylindrotheca closterium TaxID=2856 RepID=A0AAD2JJW2_9STRA|nr:unnamed protein product [Cylindrotheca closterium]
MRNHLLLALSCFFFLLGRSNAESRGRPCTKNDDCELSNSICVENLCINKFYRDGCLKSYVPNWTKIRVCNSDDPPEAEDMGFCRQSKFDYMEIRALAQDWETSWFSTWILQILLSEILDVPVSVETGGPNMNADFYGRNLHIDSGIFEPNFLELDSGAQNIDCRKVKNSDPENYESCAQIILETWNSNELSIQPDIENPRDLGALGAVQWFVPRFTAEKDPSLLSYIGLSGEDKRRKLAETFKRPTSWTSYCQEVSGNNCTIDDGVATRAPLNEEEGTRFFSEGLYIGHFRATDENDCDRFPNTCTGHFADFPCDWTSNFRQQAYHLGIPLKSSGSGPKGYKYGDLAQIWAAANATKSDVMMLWWHPDSLYEQYIETDAEFTRVVLPPPTQECVDNRADYASLCGTNEMAKVGTAKGACDTYAQSLKKLIASTLRDATFDSATPEALWSPAYDVISNFQISSLQYGEIFQNRFQLGGGDVWNLDNSRDATCRWVVDNLDYIESFIPDTYPRVLREETDQGNLFLGFGVGLASLAIVLVLIALGVTCVRRDTKAMYIIQPQILLTLLFGLLLVAAGALVLSLNPTDATCVTTMWLTDIGNVFVLTPMAMRVYTINKAAGSGKRMQRVRIPAKAFYRVLGCFLWCIVLFLSAWTVLDAPDETLHFDLTNEKTADDEIIVYFSDWCSSNSNLWALVSLLWKAMILLPAIVVTGVTSRVDDINGTRGLGFTLIVRSFFLVVQASILATIDGERGSASMAYISYILSADTIATTLLFVVPKFMTDNEIIQDEIPPDLFLNTTVMIADIYGFTAWTSVREPVQVFKFLETLYERFDSIADRHGIFKVDTTGEHYVAASGLPEARADHAIVMARFGSECLKTMESITKQLEMKFGPGTGDLTLRIGMHSGPVTGGFMRGKKGTFQLFGDTVTTAGLIHTCGQSNRIHMSESMAHLLIDGGKRKWVQRCETKIQTVEKGELQTFWLIRKGQLGMAEGAMETRSNADTNTSVEELLGLETSEFEASGHLDSQQRWIAWNTETLGQILKKVGALHQHLQKRSSIIPRATRATEDGSDKFDMPLEEVQEIIELPAFDKEATKKLRDYGNKMDLPLEVVEQLREYVTHVAGMYENNPFHNFAHASYVVMAVSKYMARIFAASEIDVGHDEDRYLSKTHAAIHDHTYGITSDPLTQFACLFAALIHDVDHPGVTNAVLMKENQRLATIYKNRSVAEQNSFDMAWDLFMDRRFDAFRGFLCGTESRLRRFRQLVINCVMATDLGDKELKELRNGRWNKAFLESSERTTSENISSSFEISEADTESSQEKNEKKGAEDRRVGTNRKATIVIEHLIQAADVAHTCQHWTVYRKWNERLFQECYEAYHHGRVDKNPADNWYQGEIGFFDFYIIPLSEKLRDCGVFGQTSDENLNYAKSNRALWVQNGEAIVEEMLAKYKQKSLSEYDDGTDDDIPVELKPGDEPTASLEFSN